MSKQETIDGMLQIAKLCDENEDSNSACLARQIAARLGDLPDRAFTYKSMPAAEAAPAPEATPEPEQAPIQEVSAEVQDTAGTDSAPAKDGEAVEQPVEEKAAE